MQDDTEFSRYIEDLKRQNAIAAHERHHQSIADARKAAIEAATTAIRLMILVNGGAVVALLAFAGALETGESGSIVTMDALAAPIMWFAIGVGLSALTATLAYLVNLLDEGILASLTQVWEHPYILDDAVPKHRRITRILLHWAAMFLALGSLVAFFVGVFQVTAAISGLGV